ncbi:MAG: MMPL family transporter, partial [Actinomycetia bacterium]|nr:MMPL family transporter [Actinomycetes bacterium]
MHRVPAVSRPLWDRFGGLVSSPLSWVLALVVTLAGGALLALVPDTGSAEQAPVVLPAGAESAQVTELLKQFPGGDQAPVILLVTRSDGQPLSPADLAAADQARARTVAAAGDRGGPPIPPVPSADG